MYIVLPVYAPTKMVAPRPYIVPVDNLKRTMPQWTPNNTNIAYPSVVPTIISDWALMVSAINSSDILGWHGGGCASSGICQRRPPDKQMGRCNGVTGYVGRSFTRRWRKSSSKAFSWNVISHFEYGVNLEFI